ncbi:MULTISPECIES: hypothetical protein [unclassified Pseudomonas]|uniref:hypothetical protein n=1 Tax=unclassified Pseudomonas TaxID=196821 RepID=UPI0024476675|nr:MULTISPECIES: hypothetical protein [unclassified Pseudomonas]MDG9926158.1 hypothetical protein [Pseudomonas sp. GD04045]MDH0037502.1 hypothetical protein [Pseudomonas sp. GD04019]
MSDVLNPVAPAAVAKKSGWLARADGVGNWLVSVAFNLCLPLAPLIVEYAITGGVSDSNMVLAASIYSVTTGVASRSTVIFSLSILMCFFYTAMFGFLIDGQKDDVGNFNALWALCFLLLSNIVLKFKLHVVDLKPYTDFTLRAPQ